MKISIVVAMDEKRGIGKDNKLLWYIPEDLKRFRTITSGHPIIMGRKTYESIGRPLPNRTNIVITHSASLARGGLAKLKGVVVVHSLEEAIEKVRHCHPVIPNSFQDPKKTNEEMLNQVQHDNKKEVFIIGGGQIFEQALPMVDRLYLTIVKGDYGADTFFPDYSQFTKVIHKEQGKSGNYSYTFLDLERGL